MQKVLDTTHKKNKMISEMGHNFLSLMLKDSEDKKRFKGNDMVPSHCAYGINYKLQSK
jgi:hypothetical protein